METMLAPEPSTLDEIYDEERAIEMFVPGYTEVAIKVREKSHQVQRKWSRFSVIFIRGGFLYFRAL